MKAEPRRHARPIVGGPAWTRGAARPAPPTPPASPLEALLREIDGGPFASYRRLVGSHDLGEFRLHVDRVPPDSFAGPARARLAIPRAKTGLPASLVESRWRRTGVEDFVSRSACEASRQQTEVPASAPVGIGRIHLEPPGRAILERASCRISDEWIELRLFVDLPASDHRVRGRSAFDLLSTEVVRLGTTSMLFSKRQIEEAGRHARAVERHSALQVEMLRRGFVAFVPDGARLATAGRSVPFRVPPALEVTFDLPDGGAVRGMGIPAGVTVITGAAFHGKSTLLRAIASGVDPHPPGDGREGVTAVSGAVAIRAEAGRAVHRVDLSAFLGPIPSGELPSDYSTDTATAAVSEAASVMEAIEVGASVLLLDEDTSAASFLFRDARMRRLLSGADESESAFLEHAHALHRRLGVSTILASGSSGDALEVADTVIRMSAYQAEDVTAKARAIAPARPLPRAGEKGLAIPAAPRILALPAKRSPEESRVGIKGPRGVRIGSEVVDLGALEQLSEPGQVRAIAHLLRDAAPRLETGAEIRAIVEELDHALDGGLDSIDPPAAYDLSRPRSFEIAAALNRWRAIRARRTDRDSTPGRTKA